MKIKGSFLLLICVGGCLSTSPLIPERYHLSPPNARAELNSNTVVLIGASAYEKRAADSAMATGTAAMAALSGYAPTNEPVFSGNVSIESITNSSTSVVFRVAIELPVGTHLLSDSYVKMSGLPGMPVWPGYLWNSNGHVMVSP